MVASLIVVAGASFYGGMKYVESTSSRTLSPGVSGGFQSRTGMGVNRASRGSANGGFTSGEIIAKDATNLTIKLVDGGSKIVFYTGTTPVTKTIGGTPEDVAVGKTVLITGKSNPDGSINAEQIQLRPLPTQPQALKSN